jgi:hypothetical protein
MCTLEKLLIGLGVAAAVTAAASGTLMMLSALT